MKYGVKRTLLTIAILAVLFVKTTGVAEAKRWFHPDTEYVNAERICRDGITLSAVTDDASESNLRGQPSPDRLGYVTKSLILSVALYSKTDLPPLFDEFASPDDFPDTAPKPPTDPTTGKPYAAVDYGNLLAQGSLDTTIKAQAYEVGGENFYDYTSITLVWRSPLAPGTKIVIESYVAEDHEATIFYTAIVDPCDIASFTYQGYLSDAEKPADGVFDFKFTLYDGPQNGKPWGTAVERLGITVKNGYFTTELPMAGDLLAMRDLFDNTAPWLEIGVRPTGVGAYGVLNPRQPLMPVPYAQYTRYAQNADYASNAGYSLSTDGITVNSASVMLEKPLQVSGGFMGNSAIEASSAGEKPTIKIENTTTGIGNGAEINITNGNGIKVASEGTYATIYAENSGTGNGIATKVGNGNAINAANSGNYATIYGENSGAGIGGAFTSYNGTNILVAQEEVTTDIFNTRFRVTLGGDVYADGKFLPNGADFAEMLVAAPNLEPGDVLIIDTQGILNRSSTPNAQNVAGIYSTKPGIVGGLHEGEEPEATVTANLTSQKASNSNNAVPSLENSQSVDKPAAGPDANEQTAALPVVKTVQPDPVTLAYTQQGKVPLALVGIVPVKVCAENGPIQPGDLLTTSSMPGYAMKAAPLDLGGVPIYRPGTIIGKALEPLSSGDGVIRVLITLQ